MSDQAEALSIFMYSGGAFGIFISIMFFVIFSFINIVANIDIKIG